MRAATFLLLAAMLALSGCGGGGAPPGSGSSAPAPVVVTVSPKALGVQLGAVQQFTATASDGLGVTWSISPSSGLYGSIDSTGLYTAPATMPGGSTVTVTAASISDPTKFDTAGIVLQSGPVFGAFPVTFEVKTRGGWQNPVAPVSVGVPLPRGLHTDANTLRLQSQGGAAVPGQFRVTSRWPGGTIRWVLVDFVADLSGPGGVGEYQLNDGGSGNATGTNLSIADSAGSVVVNTGFVEFTVNKNNFRLFDSIKIDRDLSGAWDECLNTANMEGIVVSHGATDYLMDQIAPTRVQIEAAGPIRATIVVEGMHRSSLAVDKLSYVVRITAWNDLPFISVQYSFKNMQGHGVPAASPSAAAAQLAAYEVVDSINLDLPLDFNTVNPSARVAGNPGDHLAGGMTGGQYLSLVQDYTGAHDATDPENPQPGGYNVGTGDGSADPLTNTWPTQDDSAIGYLLDNSGTQSTFATHAPGWMQVAAGTLRVTAAVQDFWQLFPKELRAQGDGLMRVGIWPATAAQLEVFAGAMKTHQVLFSFTRAGSIDVNTAQVVWNLANDPPRGICDPRHYAATRAFGEIAWTNTTLSDTTAFRAASKPFAQAYMAEVINHMGDILNDRSEGNAGAGGHQYGMWHYGDSKHDTPVAGWENHDWEISRAALQWFAMSGNIELLNLAEVTARQFRDVTVLHSDIGLRFDYTEAGNPAVSGGKASQLGKTRFFPNNKQHDLGNYHFGQSHLDVFKGAFLAEHYLLTGDALSLEVLKEIYTYLRGTWKRFFDAGNGGVDSTMTCPTTWLSNALYIATAYEVANGLHDAGAASLTGFVLACVRARQNTPTPHDPNGDGFADSSGNFKAWEVGHLMEALEYTRWHRDDSSCDADITDAMNWLLGTNAQVYLGNLTVPRFGEFAEMPGGTVNFGGENLLLGAGYVGALRGSANTNWKNAADNLLDAQTQEILSTLIADDGMRHRTFALYFRAGPMLLAAIRQ